MCVRVFMCVRYVALDLISKTASSPESVLGFLDDW